MELRNWDETNRNDFIGRTIEGFLVNRPDEDLVDVIRTVLETDINLDFLLELKTKQLEILAGCIRDRLAQKVFRNQIFKDLALGKGIGKQ